MVCGCGSNVVIPSDEGAGGAGGGVVDPVGGAPGEGAGGAAVERSILIDAALPAGGETDALAILLAGPDGSVRGTWRGGELPVETTADDGDVVWFIRHAGSGSQAFAYRVTANVTAVTRQSWRWVSHRPCELGPPMTLVLDIPEIEDGRYFDIRFSGANYYPFAQLEPGLNEMEVRACPETSSFDIVLLPQEFGNTEYLAFARIDDIAYVPGSTVTVPVTFSTERALVDVIVETEPGTAFSTSGSWYDEDFGHNGLLVGASAQHVMGETGSASLQYGPFDLGPGYSTVTARVPAVSFNCELDMAWKTLPSDGLPLHAKIGSLAGFAETDDGNVLLAEDGDVGDVMTRSEDDYESPVTSYYELNEDPSSPFPLPVQPEVTEDLVPGFRWPGPGAELRYVHEDIVGLDGYGAYVQSRDGETDGRARHRVPEGCF